MSGISIQCDVCGAEFSGTHTTAPNGYLAGQERRLREDAANNGWKFFSETATVGEVSKTTTRDLCKNCEGEPQSKKSRTIAHVSIIHIHTKLRMKLKWPFFYRENFVSIELRCVGKPTRLAMLRPGGRIELKDDQ